MKETWAIVNSGYHDAATNMAIDEALLDWHSEGKIPPIIRFYGWTNPSLSVGKFQNVHKTIDFSGVEKHQCDFVRRLTGGSAVLHNHELTYSIIVNEAHPKIPSTVDKAYYVLAEGLLQGYRALGIETEFAQPRKKPRSDRSAVCFETPAIYEMLVDGKKISGNAQTRQKGVLLQHGSLPLSIDAEMLFDLFQFPNDKIKTRQQNKFIHKATSILEVTAEAHNYESLVPVFLEHFEKNLDIATEEFLLSDELWEHVSELRETKYATEAWNKREKRTTRSV